MLDKWLDWTERNCGRAMLIALALLVAVVGLTFASLAHAGDATVSWTLPTQNTDGSAIPATGTGSLTATRVEYGTCSGTAFGTKSGEVTVPAPGASVTISGFAAGSTACFRAAAQNTFGIESAMSAVVSKTFPAPTPKPPVITTVSGLVWEYRVHPVDGPYLARAVGSIDAGKLCLGLAPLYGEDLFRVRRADVTLDRGGRLDAVLVARCEARS